MDTFRRIEIETWERRELFSFYRTFKNANYNVSVSLDIAPLYRFAKTNGHSFFLLTLFAISKAMNALPEMRQRVLDAETIAEYDVIHPSCPLAREGSDLFVQALLPHAPTFREFAATAIPIIESVRNGKGKLPESGVGVSNLFCASCVPWFSATEVSVADYKFNQDEQVLTWFKMTPEGKVTLSGRFNHAFTDGIHLGRFFNATQENFLRPEVL